MQRGRPRKENSEPETEKNDRGIKEQFVSSGDKFRYIDMGWIVSEMNEDAGFSVPEAVRSMYKNAVKSGKLIYMTKSVEV